MHSKKIFLFMLFSVAACSASRTQAVAPSPETDVTPNTLHLYRADIVPGKEGAYAQAEAGIVKGYASAKIPAYWLALQAVTSSPHVLYFDGFDSFAAIEKAGTDVLRDSALTLNWPASRKSCRSTSRQRERSWPSAATTSAIG